MVKIRTYIDKETGEILGEDEIANRYYGSKPFWKLYKDEFVKLLIKYDGKQKDVLLYIVDNVKRIDNTFHGTYKTISKAVRACEATVAKTMVSLQKDGFITISSVGIWKVNPNYLINGSEQKRIGLYREFCELQDKRAIISKKEVKTEVEE